MIDTISKMLTEELIEQLRLVKILKMKILHYQTNIQSWKGLHYEKLTNIVHRSVLVVT